MRKELEALLTKCDLIKEEPSNSGYVEADYKKGVVILKPTDKKENNIDERTIRKL